MIMLFSIAKKTIKIVTPYFLPTESVSESLKLAAMNNIDIQIILPGKRDNKDFIIPMNRSQYPDFMDRNVKIHEYNGFIHSKYIIVDDKYVYTTSANFDFRSLIINFENGILFDSPKICNEMLAIFQDDLANSRLVTIEDLVKYNTLRSKLRIKLLNLYKPLI
ncbi:hypothetical protein FACS1894218_2540 [Bacilli bacterium]|nr:hypothetical protein FACS1894218_2540 [Bacilli bacterium]